MMTKRVRIDDVLVEQVDCLDIFPRELWSREQKVNYCARIGLGVLLELFQQQAEEHDKAGHKLDRFTDLIGRLAIEDVLRHVHDRKIPQSQVARLVCRGLYED